MTDYTVSSSHIMLTEDWQPTWRHSTVDIVYYLQLLCSRWLFIVVVCLAATPSTEGYQQMYPVKTRTLDNTLCLSVHRSCSNCTSPPPQILLHPPWEIGTTTTKSSTTMTSSSTVIPVMTTTTADISAAAATIATAATLGTTTPTPPIKAVTPIKTTRKTAEGTSDVTTGKPLTGDDEFSKSEENFFESENEDSVSREDKKEPVLGVITSPSDTGDGSGGTSVNTEEPNKDPTKARIWLPIIIILLAIITVVCVRIRPDQRGRCNLQKALQRMRRSRSRNPPTNTNGAANNQSAVAVESGVNLSPITNKGSSAKSHDNASDQEDNYINSQMLKMQADVGNSTETPENTRRSSKTPDKDSRRPSRQIRLDSRSPLVPNMDGMSDAEEEPDFDKDNGTSEDEMKGKGATIMEEEDDAFEEVHLEKTAADEKL